MRVPDWLSARAHNTPRHQALRFEGREYTFSDLMLNAGILDQSLTDLALGKGDVVATVMHSDPDLVASVHAIPRRGRILLPLSPRLTAGEISARLEVSKCRTVLCEADTEDLVSKIEVRQPIDAHRVDRLVNRGTSDGKSDGGSHYIETEETHSIVFTSGTSGRPRGVLLTWGNHLWSATASAFNLGLHPDDRWLACLPFNHVGGLSILIRSVLYGNSVELHRGFDPAAVNAAIHERRVSIISVVANMLQRMLDANGAQGYPSSLRAILVGGGPVPESLLQQCRDQDIPARSTYGLTECASQVTTHAPQDREESQQRTPGQNKVRTDAGTPLLFTEVRIVDGEGNVRPQKAAGEIEVRGPTVSPGYVGEPARNRQNWFRTHDQGFLDEGRLTVLGRSDDTVVSGGENIHPGEIERVLERHPDVDEAFATGCLDADWGQVICASALTQAELSENELLSFSRQHLAGYKVPKYISVVNNLPRTATGKIARKEAAEKLRAEYRARATVKET